MSNADPLDDLAIRRRQLETHLLQSHDYRNKARARLKLLAVVFAASLVLVLGESMVYVAETKPSPVVLGSIDVTSLLLLLCAVLFVRTSRCLRRLNERWLTPDAKRALQALRLEQGRTQPGSQPEST